MRKLKLSVFLPAVIALPLGIILFTSSIISGEEGFISLILLAWGLYSFAVLLYHNLRLKRFKKDGDCYEAVIIKLERNSWIRRGLLGMSAKMECEYANKDGLTSFALSRDYMIGLNDEKDDFRARVYVDKNNPGSYEVELYRYK